MKIKLLILFLCFVTLSHGQSIFDNPITGSNPGYSNPFTSGQTVDPNITVSGIGMGSGVDGNISTDRYNARRWDSTTLDVNDYFEFTLTPNANYKINFTSFVYIGQTSGTGPINFSFRSSLDGFTSTSTIIDSSNGAFISSPVDLSGASFQNISTPITFRLYGWGGTHWLGTFSINDFTFNGVVVCNLSAPTIGTITQPTCATPTGSIAISGLPSTGTWTLTRSGTSSATTTGTGTTTTVSGLAVGSYDFTVSSGACTSAPSTTVAINAAVIPVNTYSASGWDNGTPNSNQTLVFNETYSSPGNIEGCSCIANADVTFNAGHTLTLTNEITVANLKNVVFEDGASLVQINNVANSGDIQYKRTTSSRVSDYTYVSSPVYSLVLPQTLGDLVSPTGTFYSYEVTSSDEYWEKRAATDAMDIGKGYIVAPSLEIPVGTPPKSPFDLFFLGVPNNGHYEISGIFADKSYLLGNPYPSAINADSFLTANSGVLDGTLYFWTHSTAIQETANITDGTAGTGAYAYTSNDYASYNITGGVGVATGNTIPGPPPTEDITNKPNGYIAAGQGFFASSKGAPTDSKIVFDNNMRVASTVLANGTGANQQFFKTRLPKTETVKSIEKNRIWLNLTNAQGAFKQTLVGYITNATNDYDSGFDGESFDGNAYVDFYSINQDKNLTIQGRALPFDTNDEVPLGYKSTISGAFTINIEQVDGFLTNQDVFLEDKLTNTLVDLKSGSYTFSTVPGTFNDRFVLRYTNKTLGTNDFNTTENKVLVSCKNKQITINSFAETLHKVVIYDLLGKQLYQKNKVNSNALLLANLNCSPQTLIVKTSLKNGETRTDKVIFQ